MAAMLHKGLGKFQANFRPTRFGMASHGKKILVHPMLFSQPFSLRFMAGKHFGLVLKFIRDINVEVRFSPVSKKVFPFLWIHIEERGNVVGVRFRY